MIDQNRDGFIDSEDLKDMLASLGMSALHTIAAKFTFFKQGKSLATRLWTG